MVPKPIKYIIFLVVGIILAGVTLFYYAVGINQRYQPDAFYFIQVLSFYLEANDGEFPQSENDLIEQGYMQKETQNDHIVYSLRLDPSARWWRLTYDFAIRYGVTLDSVALHDDAIIDSATGLPVNLIQGPKNWIFDHVYRNSSVRMYREMRRFSQKSAIDPNNLRE